MRFTPLLSVRLSKSLSFESAKFSARPQIAGMTAGSHSTAIKQIDQIDGGNRWGQTELPPSNSGRVSARAGGGVGS